MELPKEIINQILQQYPDLILTGRQLSKETSQLLNPSFIQQICRKKITPHEFQNYLLTSPKFFALIDSITSQHPLKLPNIIEAKLYLNNFGERYSEHKISTDYFDYPGNNDQYVLDFRSADGFEPVEDEMELNPGTPSIYHNYPDILGPETEPDLLTIYKILMKRLNCLKINSRFAKEIVIDRFNHIVNQYLNHRSQARILDLYLYLILHTWIFNIEGIIPDSQELAIKIIENDNPDYLDRILDIPYNLRTINYVKQEIQRLIVLVRDELDRLR